MVSNRINSNVVFRYGFVGFVLSFATLPLYVAIPKIYSEFGLSISIIGFLLMLIRLTDAITDPIFGKLIDSTKGRKHARWLKPSLVVLIVSFGFLINPPNLSESPLILLVWFFSFTLIVSLFNGICTIAYQSWVVAISKVNDIRNRLISAREVCALTGLILASFLIGMGRYEIMATLVFFSGLIAIYYTKSIEKNIYSIQSNIISTKFLLSNFLKTKPKKFFFLASFLVAFANGIPALLFVFFYKDVLKINDINGGFLLAIYFLSAAFSIPIWRRVMVLVGNKATWISSVVLSIVFFSLTVFLSGGDFYFFLIICIFTGIALGAELICPPSVLTDILSLNKNDLGLAGTYFGVWNLLIKCALALTAGIVLPSLFYLGYDPNFLTDSGVNALGFMYSIAPCIIKAISLIFIIKIIYKPI